MPPWHHRNVSNFAGRWIVAYQDQPVDIVLFGKTGQPLEVTGIGLVSCFYLNGNLVIAKNEIDFHV